jgi:hypothetical protein
VAPLILSLYLAEGSQKDFLAQILIFDIVIALGAFIAFTVIIRGIIHRPILSMDSALLTHNFTALFRSGAGTRAPVLLEAL